MVLYNDDPSEVWISGEDIDFTILVSKDVLGEIFKSNDTRDRILNEYDHIKKIVFDTFFVDSSK